MVQLNKKGGFYIQQLRPIKLYWIYIHKADDSSKA